MAYRSVLSGLSILRGVRKALETLRLQKGNHREIWQQVSEVNRSYDGLMEYKRQYDGRFAGVRSYNMTHHLVSAQPHTNLSMSKIVTDAVINILPDSDISRIVVSHSTDETKEQQQEVENWIIDIARHLSDRDNKRPFIDLVANTFDAYIAPGDYKEWSEKDKEALMTTAATSMKEFFTKYDSPHRRIRVRG